ncbi:MAG: GxxExxY protein [Candidatus Thermoplasmatota archaeon]
MATAVVDAVFQVRKQLGAGLDEDLYKTALGMELTKRHIPFVREASVPVHYDGVRIGVAVPDFLIDDCLVLEAKAVEKLVPPHFVQTLTYLRFTGRPLALLVNFHAVPLGPGIRRLVPPPR